MGAVLVVLIGLYAFQTRGTHLFIVYVAGSRTSLEDSVL
jgi:hypothetical protein